MAKQKIVWTALPYGRVTEGPLAGRLRVSIVVSPRLTPEVATEQQLGAAGFADFQDWPKTLQSAKLQLRIGANVVPLEIVSTIQPGLWKEFFGKTTPVAGFVFKDMSRVNLRSYAVRNVLGFVRKHYGNLATMAAGTHPTLLPWSGAHGSLKGMLTDLGTRTQKIVLGNTTLETMVPGFDRFFDDQTREGLEKSLGGMVFGPDSRYRAPVVGVDGTPGNQQFAIRALPPDWRDPAGGSPDAPVMSQFATADEYTFYQANRFYRRNPPTPDELKMRRPDQKNVPPPIKPPEFDFHQIVASLADYPQVLRALGLIIDCALPAANPIVSALSANPTADGAFSVEIGWSNGHDPNADAYPGTAYRASKSRFVTRARTAEHTDGLLQLAGTVDPTLGSVQGDAAILRKRNLFDVYQVDPDGAGLKTTDFLLTAQNLVGKSLKPGTHGEVTYTTGDKQPVAALRSGGLGVSRHGRAAQVAMTAAATALKNTAVETSAVASRNVVLYTEDVLRGYRVDVQNQSRWFSLMKREGDYQLIKSHKAVKFDPDEGYVKGASTTGDGSDDHYLHESLFRWTGWSLAAPRPGRTIAPVEGEGGLQGESVDEIDETAKKGNGLAVHFRAQRGTLPRLRFGQDYRFRARIVDLAGNSLAVSDESIAPLEQATETVSYLRYEPVDPPALVHRHRVSEGESLERMVIRSNYDKSPSAYLQTPDFATATQQPASQDFEYVADNQRHVVPPKSSQLQCEEHALFDAAFGSGSPAAIKGAYETAAREAGTLYDALPGTQIELVTPASVKDVALTAAVPPAPPSPQKPTGERLVGGQYILHREAAVQTPYLPDGAAAGFALRGSRADLQRIGITQPMVLGPGAAVVQGPNQELVLVVRHGNDWPKTQGLRIVLAERAHSLDDGPCQESFPDDGRPKWDENARVLTLFLRKGHIARLIYSSFIDPRFIDQFGIPRWSNSVAEQKFIAGMALLGMHWMMTPYRPLVLVHATQQPVCTPRLQKIVVQREVGGTFADLDAAVQLHGPSTGKMEVTAHWQEWVDDLQQPRPQRLDMTARLAEIPLPENGPNNFGLAAAAIANQPPQPNNVPGATRAKGNRHDFGDTKFRLIRYRIEATTRFREYLPPSLYAQHDLVTRTGPEALESLALLGADTDAGAPVLFNVAGATPNGTSIVSTAVPEVPHVVYTVPTFKWSQDVGADKPTQTSIRLGNALRVYLERPWFSSGDGELLGVVLLGDGSRFTDIPEAMVPYVTQWGLDPMFDSVLPKSLAGAADFTARVISENVALQETGASVHVVGHRVQWDEDRKLWYSDIELDSGVSYMPFVRLALVRYQPQSLFGMKVSRVAIAEFSQLLPRRRAVVTRNGQSVQAHLHGPVPDHGPMHWRNDGEYLNISFIPQPGSALESGRNRVELVLQTRDPNIDSDLAWSDVSTLSSSLALPPGATLETVGGAPVVNPFLSANAVAAPLTVTRAGTLGDLQAFPTQLQVTTAPSAVTSPGSIVATNVGSIIGFIDPAVWTANVTLPQLSAAPARLVLREFERYYTDRTVPERRGTQTYRKRVVEERLVYSEFFPLN